MTAIFPEIASSRIAREGTKQTGKAGATPYARVGRLRTPPDVRTNLRRGVEWKFQFLSEITPSGNYKWAFVVSAAPSHANAPKDMVEAALSWSGKSQPEFHAWDEPGYSSASSSFEAIDVRFAVMPREPYSLGEASEDDVRE